MLELLHIENIAVIESADISFCPGFNALTGETGAGKSIVIDAMSAVLGGRASRELIRTGADKAFVSAVFSQVPSTLPGLADNGVTPDEDGNLLLQREICGDGKNVCRANGRPLTVTQLRQIGGELLNIHGQHDGQQLLDEEQHGAYLDRFGRMEAPLAAYRSAYNAMAAIRDQIRSLQMNEAEKARRMDSLRFQIDELERAQLVPGEEESLTERRDLLRNGEKYLSALSGADYCLNGGEEGGGAVSALRDAEEALAGVRFGDEVVPSPAAFVAAEEQEHHRAEGQQVVADDEVFQIEDHGAGAEGLDAGQHVEAEGAGQGEQEDQNEVDGDRLLAGPFEHVDAVGYDVFQHGDDRGEGREAHEDEEEHAPQLSAGHAVEHVGKGDEHEAGTGARIDVEGETGREDDEARHERDERIQ